MDKFLAFVACFASAMSFAAPVATIGETEYETLAEAFAAVPADGTQTTVKILEDISATATVAMLPAKKSVILDLGGHTISGSTSSTNTGLIQSSGSLVIRNGTIAVSGKGVAVKGAVAAAKITLESGTIAATGANAKAVYMVQTGLFQMEGGSITSETEAISANNVVIHDGAVHAQSYALSGGGVVTGGDLSSSGAAAIHATATLAIEGGTISGANSASAIRIYSGDVTVPSTALLYPSANKVSFTANASAIVKTDAASVAPTADLALYNGETLIGFASSASTATTIKEMSGTTVKLLKDITTTTGWAIQGNDVTVDLNGHSISSSGLYAIKVKGTSASSARAVTITGEGSVSCDNGGGCVAVYADQFSNVTLAGGTYSVGGDKDNACVYIYASKTTAPTTVTITGGSYETGDGKYVLNINDAARTTGGATMAVTGGTFKDFDPANNIAEGEGTSFIGEGIVAVPNEDGVFEVRDYVWVKIPEVEHATASVTIDGAPAEIVDGKIKAPVGSKVIVKYAAEDEWANTLSKTYSKIAADTTVDVSAYKPVPAKVKIIAKDGTVSYSATLTTMNAKDGATYQLLDDVTTSALTLGSVGYKNNSITLDLNGHTLKTTSTSAGFKFNSNGSNNTLTMKNGTFISAAEGFAVNKANTLVLEDSLTVKAAKSCVTVVGNGATLETAANLTTTGDTFAIAGNGSAGNGGTTIKVTGGSVTTEGKAPAIYQPQSGTLEISGGTITGASAVYAKCGEISITGGKLVATGEKGDYAFNGNGAVLTGDALIIDNCNYPGGAPTVSVTGGRFESAKGEAIASYSGAKAGETAPAPIIGFVSGEEGSYPTFNQPLSDELCASGFRPHDDGIGGYTIETLPSICEVEGVGYWSLQLAVDAAAKSGNPIELIDDVTITERVIVPAGQKVVLDLQGHTLSSMAPTYAFGLKNGSDFELTNGTLAAKDIGVYAFPGSTLTVAEETTVTSETFYGLFVNGATADIKGTIETTAKDGYGVVVWGEEDAPFDVTVSGTVHASGVDAPAIGGNGTDRNPANKLTIVEGANVSAEKDVAIFWPNEGTLAISGGTITGGTNGIYMKAGSLNVTGGVISSTAAEYEAPTAMVNGSNGKGSAIVIEESAKYGEFGSVSISDGSFTSKGPAVNVFGEGAPQQFITGGSFSNKVPDELCNEGFDATELLPDGSYGVTPKKTVAKIGSREFWSIDRAIEAAEKGEIVELVADYKGPGFVVGDLKDVQFSTAGFTYTATSPISVSGHLVIADESKIDFAPTNPEDTELFALVGFGEKVDISGGSFNVPLKQEWCDEAYEPAELGDGRYGVTEKQHVCTINGKGYWSVEAALKAADPFDTIVMIEDVAKDAPAVTLDRGHVTLDLNGHVISSVLVSGAVVTVTDSKRVGYIGGADVEKAVTIEAGKIFFEGGKVVAKEKALAIEQSEQGELIAVDVSGGTFVAETVIYQANVHKLPSTALDQITINVTDGVFTGNVYAEDKRAFITGGQFDPPPEKKYKRDDIKAEQPSVTVTTELDVVNPYDFKISLREALLYAEQDSHNGISEEGGYKITFNWDAIKDDADARGVEATGVFDLSSAPFEATSELYDDTTGRCKFILIDGTLDHGADGMMGEGDLMAVIRGFDFHTKDTTAPVRAVVVKKDPESVIRLVDKLPEVEKVGGGGDEGEGDVVEIAPDADQGEIDDSNEGVCELNGELYTSVRQALAAVPADGKTYTLKLVDDFTGKAFMLENGQNVVLDLGGHRYEVTNGGFTVKSGATLLLKNGSIRSNTATTLLTNAGALALENLDLDLSERPAVTTLVKTLAGSLVVTGSTSMTGTLDYVNAERVEFRGTGNYDLDFNAPLTANIRIYSGHFADLDAVPVEFQVVPLDGLYWQIVDEEGNVTKYATLHEAYATIPGDGTPVTITELFDQTDRGLVIDGNKNVTIDFNGKTFTVEGGANHNFIIDGKREVVTLKNGTLRTTAPGTLISNKGHLTLDNMNIDLRACELNPDFKNIISSTYGETVVTGDTRLAVPSEYAALAVTAQRNDDWSYDKVSVSFDEDFTGQVIGQIHYGESTGSTKDVSWLDAARIDVNGGEFDVSLIATTPLSEKVVENFRLHGGTFTRTSTVGKRPIGDFAYTIVDIDWELRLRYAHFERSSFDLIGRDNLMLVDRCSFTGASARKSDWILESDATGRTRLQFLNSVIHQAEGAILVNMSSRDVHERGGFVVIADSTIGEATGEAVIKITADDIDTYLANATFYGNAGKVVDTLGRTHAVNVLSQKNGENLPSKNVEIMTSIYQEEYADAEIFRMSEEDPTKPHFGPRYLREGTPVDEATQEGAWSLTSAYHLNDESVAGGNCRYIKLAINNDGYVEAIRTSLKPNGPYAVFAGAEETDSPLHTLHYDQTIANLDRGQPSKGAFWIPVDEPSLVVTTIRDTVNPTDLEISLREAINYAKYLATEDKKTIPTITFDWEALDEELAALRRNGIVGTAAGQLDDFTMYLGYSIDWDRRSNSGDCHLVPGRSASKPISITADELPQGLIINANRSGSVRPYFTVSGALWDEVDVPVAFELGDETKLKTDHFRVTAVEGTGYQIGKNANLYLTNSSAADSCTNGIVGDEGSTVVLERASVANNSSTGVTATNVSAQNATIDGGLTATTAQLFNTTVVGGINATTVNGVNDIVSGPISGASWFRYSAFDSYSAGDTNVTHNIKADNLELKKAQSSLLWHYRFEPALDWGRLGTAISSSKGYDWAKTGAEMPVYIWGQRTVSTDDAQDVETSGVQAHPDIWAAYRVGEDEPYTTRPMTGAILNDILTNSRNPHFEQLSMGAWQGRTIVAWKTLAREIESTDHATDFGRVDLNTYYSTLQEAVEALTINKTSGDKNVQFDGKDAIFLVSATLTNTALGENEQTIIKDGDVAIVGNSYYWSGLKSTSADAAIIVSNDCSVAFSNVGLIDSTCDGVRVYGSGHVSFNRSAVNGNGGDGIRFMDGAHGDLKLVNTTVAKNLGTGVKMQSGTAEIYDSTVAGNGIGLAGAGKFYLANSIVLKNKTANEENVTVKNAVYSVLTATGLTSEQEDAVFRDSGLSLWYRMLRVNYTGAAGWMGTLLAHDSAGNWFYLDRGDAMKDDVAKENWMWTPVRAGVTQTGALEVITSDQHATSRLLAENAGFHEYAVGAYVPEMELEVEVMNQFTPYNGKAQNPDPNKAIYLIRTGIGKLNQGHELYYNAADKKFYGEFAYVTNRVANAEGVAPAPWGEPTVSNPRTDITDFGFSADIVPIQAGDKINVLRRTVPGAKVEGGFSVDEGGYAYLDGYPFTVTDVSLTKGGRDLTESYTVRYPQTEVRDYAMMYITPKSISLSRAFAPTKEYDGTANVVITADSLEHAGILFGEVVISPASKFEYNGADVIDDYEKNIVVNPDGTVTVLANSNTSLKAEDLGFIGSPSVMGNYYITSESQNYTSIVVPKKIRVSLGEIAKKLYDGETTTMTFDFTDDRLIYTATNSVAQETTTLAEALILPTRYLDGQLTVCRNIDEVIDRSQVFPAHVGEYPFYIVADKLHVRDTVETTKDFTRNYAFDFTEAKGIFTVQKRPVTLPIDVEDIIYSGEQIVAVDAAISAEPIPTGVKDEAFTVRSLGEANANYETAHVKGNEERQKISIDDSAKVVFEGVNGAEADNYFLTFAPTGKILRRPLSIHEINGVQTKLYDGSTVVKVDTNNTKTYSYIDATDAPEKTGLVGTEFVKLTGTGRVENEGVGATLQKVEWNALSLLDDTGKANDYALQPFETDFEDVSVRIEPCDLQLAFSTKRVYDGTLGVTSLALSATTTNSAGKVTTLKVTQIPAEEGAAWSFKVQTGIVNERTEVEEVVFIDVTSATLTKGEVNTYAGDRRDVLVVAEAKLRAEAETGAVIANYRAFVGERDIATEKDFVGTARIDRRPITFQAADRTMVYGGLKPVLSEEGSYVLLNEADLAVGDKVAFVKLAFDTNNIRKSRSGEFQKGYYEKGIVRGDVSIVDENGATKNRNYTITVKPGALQVGPGTLSMVLDPTPFVKDYDGTTVAEEKYEAITLKGLIKNNITHEFDDVTVTGIFTYDTKDVVYANETYANKTITFHLTEVGGKDAANYDWATDAGGNVIVEVSAFGATINPRTSTVNVFAADKDYDSTCVAQPTTASFSNLVAGEEFDLEMTDVTAAFADKHRGVNKPVVVSLNGELLPRISPTNDKALTANYVFTFDPNTTATIRGIPFVVAADSKAMTYGDANPDLTVPTETTTAGDTATIELNYSSKLAKSTSGNFTAKTHAEAIKLKSVVITDAHGEDVTDSYDIAYTSAELTVAPRTLTVSVEGDGVTKVYDGTTAILKDQENHAIANNITESLAKNATADEVDVTGAFAYNTKDVLAATTVIFSNLALTGADAANYTLAGVTEVSDTGAMITPFETTVTIAANDKTYDGNKSATAKSAAFAPLVGGEKFALDLAQIYGTFIDRHAAANKAVTWNAYSDDLISAVDATGAIKSNYKFAHNLAATATINPKPATITFSAKNKMYDATTAAERTEDPFVFEGLIVANEEAFAEAFTLNDESMSYAFSDKNVGEGKTVTARGYNVAFVASSSTGGVSVSSDYAFSFTTTAKADITKKPITISYTTLDKVYDANTVATRDAFDYGELIKGDVLTLNDKTMAYAFETKDVGEGLVVTATNFDQKLLEGADVKNYEVSFNVTSSAAITRRPVTITFALVEKTYDGTVLYRDGEELKLLAPVVTNMADGESLEVRTTGEFIDKEHNEIVTDYFQVDAFAFEIAEGGDLGNYTVTWAKDRVLALEAGTMAFEMTVEGAFLTDGRINRRPITITANDQAMTYGEANPELNTAVSGEDGCDWAITTGEKVAWDTVTATLAYGMIPKSNSGNYKATEGGAAHANAVVKQSVVIVDDQEPARDVTDSYAITFVNGKLAVAKRALSMTLSGSDFTKVYDGDASAKQSVHTLVNNVEKDVVDIKGTYNYNSKNVTESETVTATGLSITGADAANYKLTEESYTSTTGAKITPRPTVITVKPADKVYDGTPNTTAQIESFSNLVSGESFNLDKSKLTATFAQSDVGTAVEVTYVGYNQEQVSAGANTRLDNYSFEFTNKAVGDITKRPSTITWEANNKKYDALVAATVKSGSFVFGSLVDGESFTMNEAGFTYTFADKNVGAAKPVTAVPNGTLEALISPVAAPAKVSNYAFTLTKTALANITPAPLTITFTTKDKTYDATPKATRDAFTYAPLLVDDKGKTDVVTLDDSKMEYAFVDVGGVENTGKNADAGKTVKTVEGKGYDKSYLRGVDKDNYTVTFTDASTATINKMELRLDLPKADKVYDATTALREGTLVTTLKGVGAETFTATALGAYKDTHANDYETYVAVTDLSIVGANGAVFGNYVIKYAGHGGEALREQTETGTYENANFQTTETFGTPGRITALGFAVAAINQQMIYGDSYPTINGDGEHWGEGKVWSLPGTKLATGDRIWVTLKWNASIPMSSAGFYTAGTHEGALVVDAIVIKRTDGTDVTASYKPTFQPATLTINPRLLTVTVDGTNFSKVYDGNRTTEEGDRAYTVDAAEVATGKGKFAADEVTVNGTYTYNDKDVEEANTVTFGELTLSGADADNYTLNGVTSVVSSEGAKITRRASEITVTTTGKTYDGNRDGNKIATYAFSSLVQKNESDVKEDFTLAIADFTGTFNSKDVETANTVTFEHAGVIKDHLTGKDETSLLSNYDFTFKPEAEAEIAPRHVTVTWKAEDKNYDQNTIAEPTLGSFVFTTPVLNMNGTQESFSVSDANAKKMTYTFSDKNVGKGKTVTATGWTRDLVTDGDDTLASNYLFDFVPTATAEIKSIKLTIGFAANDKTYDATTTATRKDDFTYDGLIVGDEFALDDETMSYAFDTKNVGTGKTVTATGFDEKYLTGADVKNYDVHFTDTAKAAITKKALTMTLSEAVKPYDGTTDFAETIGQIIPGTEGGEVLTATATGEFVSENVGSALDYFNVTELVVVGTNGADFGNYVITYNGGTIDIAALNTTETTITAPFTTRGTINKKPVTVTALSQTMKFAEARPNLNDGVDDWTDNGFVAGDVPTVTLGWNEAVIAKSKAGHAAVGTHAGAIILTNIANDSNYTVTFIPGNLEVIDDPTKTLTIGSKNSHLPITIPSNWLDRNVPTFAAWAEVNGHALVSDALLEPSANGYAKWQNYLLGLDPLDATAKLWIDGVQTSDEDKMRVLYPEVTRPESDYAVHFRLDTTLKGAAKTVSSPYQSAATFDIALGGDDPTGYYSIRCVFTKKEVAPEDVAEAKLVKGEGVSSEGIRTVNTFGLLKVDAATTNTVISTPWTALVPGEDRDVAVANLLKTATLEEDDMIHVYSLAKGRYESYAVLKEKVFAPITLVENNETIMLPPATEARVARGSGVMLSRKNPTKPLYLIGQVPTTAATTRIAGATTRESAVHHLIGAPTLEDFDLQTVQASSGTIAATTSAKELNDQIFVPTDAREPIMYTYKDGKWGYDERVATTVANMTFYKNKRVTDLPKIKAGTGFWYVSRGGNPEIVWPVIGKEVAE